MPFVALQYLPIALVQEADCRVKSRDEKRVAVAGLGDGGDGFCLVECLGQLWTYRECIEEDNGSGRDGGGVGVKDSRPTTSTYTIPILKS